MRTAFVTCVQLGLGCMEEIDRAGGRLDLVMTLPDDVAARKSGRVYVDAFCRQRGIDLVKVRNVNDEAAIAAVRDRRIDWLFIIGWSQIVRRELLAAPLRGAVGMHPTLLPQGRGRAAIPWTILKGLDETGVTLFRLDQGVDTGPVIAQERFAVAAGETATSLYRRVELAHRALIRRLWPAFVGGDVRAVPQDEAHATEWPGRTPADGELSFAMPAREADRLVRATTHPYPGAFLVDGERTIRIWSGRIPPPATLPPAGCLRLGFADGVYDAVEFQIE